MTLFNGLSQKPGQPPAPPRLRPKKLDSGSPAAAAENYKGIKHFNALVVREEFKKVMFPTDAKLLNQARGSPNMLEAFPDKPKGMHWRTYDRLRRMHDVAEERSAIGLMRLVE
jgi:hypothetical protein